MPRLVTLPELGTRETAELDFKKTTSPADKIELAKDVAALANTLGGALLLGANAPLPGSILVSYPGIPEEYADILETAYEEAVRDYCVPKPRIDFERFVLSGRAEVVLAIYVWPAALPPVGVSVRQPNPGKLVDKAWCFPWRANSHTTYLQPDQFGSLLDMETRQIAALLAGIAEADNVRIQSPALGIQGQQPVLYGKLNRVLLDQNVAEFSASIRLGDATFPLNLPLPWISTVWRDSREERWEVVVSAQISLSGASAREFTVTSPRP